MKLVYFAWVRERIGKSEEVLDIPADIRDIAGLLDWLAQRVRVMQRRLKSAR